VKHLYRPLLQALLLMAAVVLQPASCPARIWTDVSGRTIDAEIVSCDGKTVVLKSNKTGKELNVPLDGLSMPDKALALFKLHEQKAEAAAGGEPAGPPKSPEPSPPPPPQPQPAPPVSPPPPATPASAAGNRPPATATVLPAPGEEDPDSVDAPEDDSPDEAGGFTDFANSLEIGDYGGLVRGVGWGVFLLGVLTLIAVWVLISTVGIYLISLFLDFKETFGTAVMFGIGSTSIRAFVEICQAIMINLSPTLAPTVDNLLTRWMIIIAVYYPFDAFLIRRIYRADLATAARAAGAYFVWSRISTRILFALLAVAALSSLTDGPGLPPGMPPGLGE
jgi:hypothetical protein